MEPEVSGTFLAYLKERLGWGVAQVTASHVEDSRFNPQHGKKSFQSRILYSISFSNEDDTFSDEGKVFNFVTRRPSREIIATGNSSFRKERTAGNVEY
jgi:hypothetical protein